MTECSFSNPTAEPGVLTGGWGHGSPHSKKLGVTEAKGYSGKGLLHGVTQKAQLSLPGRRGEVGEGRWKKEMGKGGGKWGNGVGEVEGEGEKVEGEGLLLHIKKSKSTYKQTKIKNTKKAWLKKP